MYPPNTPVLADLPYPTDIKKAIKHLDKLYSAWADEDSKLLDIEDGLNEAKRAEAQSIKQAAKDGAPLPVATNLSDLERSLQYQEERVRLAKSEVEKAARNLTALIKEQRKEVIRLAVDKAREGVEEWRSDLTAISLTQITAAEKRSKALDGIRMVSNWGLTNEVIRFDPNFPTTGSFSIPASNETHLLTTLEGLERLFLEE